MILVIDNYDSFVHNVAHELSDLGASVTVERNDGITVSDVLAMAPSHLVLSPGPGRPSDAGESVRLVRALRSRIPILGICLGHQAIAEAYGGIVVPSPEPRHGTASPIVHRGDGILAGVPSPFPGGRYHSLSVDEARLPATLEAVAWTPDGELMALRARSAPVWGLQFHPESVLTPAGRAILAAFLALDTPGPTSEPSVAPGASRLVGLSG